MKKLFYLACWFFRARFMGRKQPLQTVLFISDRCNLRCKHCSIYREHNPATKSYAEIAEELRYSYGLGSRFVDFEGGEPLLWRDGKRDVNDLVRLAKEIGFFSATVTTNGQLSFEGCEADSIWVSMDGVGEYHDQIRGQDTFARLLSNIEKSGHKAVSVNMVINSLNHSSVGEAVRLAKEHPHIKSISLNFHTPFEGTEHLFIDWDTRGRIIDEVIRMKREGYPIMNSVSGLRLMKRQDFKKRCWVSNFIMADGTRLAECQGKAAGVCNRCGFCMAGEMHSVFSFKPDTILAGMKLRV